MGTAAKRSASSRPLRTLRVVAGDEPRSYSRTLRAMHQGEFRNPRLVAVYDAECPWSREDDFFLSIVNERPASRVLDLGCGSGRLALGMAEAGHRVTGVDPARASLDAARVKPGAERVRWIEGTSADLSPAELDAAVMTSHVAQLFVDDADWSRVLRDLSRALVPGGRLAFDARDPSARAWERWNPVDSRRRVSLGRGDNVEIWTDVTHVAGDVVLFTHHYVFADGERLASTAALRFRSERDIRSSLAAAGFLIEHIYGGWKREPVGAGDGELLILARSGATRA